MKFKVPLLPPSMNELWRKGKAGMYKTAKAGVFNSSVAAFLPGKIAASAYVVGLTFGFEARHFRRRDVDNYVKAAFDALQVCGVILNDNDIVRFSAEKIEVETLRDEFTEFVVTAK